MEIRQLRPIELLNLGKNAAAGCFLFRFAPSPAWVSVLGRVRFMDYVLWVCTWVSVLEVLCFLGCVFWSLTKSYCFIIVVVGLSLHIYAFRFDLRF